MLSNYNSIKQQAPMSFVHSYYLNDLKERNTSESQWYLKQLKMVAGQDVLNIGCGPCFFEDVKFFANLPRRYVGTDINKENIEFLKGDIESSVCEARFLAKRDGIKCNLIVDNICVYNDEFKCQFDTILLVGVLGKFSVDEIKFVSDNLYQYLRPGGEIIDIDWTDCKLSAKLLDERIAHDWYGTNGIKEQELITLLQSKGLKNTLYETLNVENAMNYGWGKIYALRFRK